MPSSHASGAAAPSCVVVPRWGGTAASDWYPSLGRTLGAQLVVCALDAPDAPTIAGSLARLGDCTDRADARVLVGHSVGCQVVLRHLAVARRPVDRVVLVAPWFTVDEPWDTLRPWLDTPLDRARVRASVGRVDALVSTNDPFTADWAATADALERDLGADVLVVDDAGHFNATHEPLVERLVRAALDAVGGTTRTS